MSAEVESLFAVVSPLTGSVTWIMQKDVAFWISADEREIAAGRFGYDILEVPALVRHRSPKRPI